MTGGFGIAVDDKELVRETLAEMVVELLNGRFMDFLDPWGNRVEITTYTNIQFSKADHVLVAWDWRTSRKPRTRSKS